MCLKSRMENLNVSKLHTNVRSIMFMYILKFKKICKYKDIRKKHRTFFVFIILFIWKLESDGLFLCNRRI